MSEKIYNKVVKDKQDNEKYILLVRRSMIAYIFSTFSDLFLLVVGGSFVYLWWSWIIYGDVKVHIVELAILIFYWLVVLFFWWYFWYFTYLLITTHRVEKHQPTYLFWHKKEVLWYNEINKISFEQPTFWSKIFDYWNVEIISGEWKNNIIFNDAPHPEQLVVKLKALKRESLWN